MYIIFHLKHNLTPSFYLTYINISILTLIAVLKFYYYDISDEDDLILSHLGIGVHPKQPEESTSTTTAEDKNLLKKRGMILFGSNIN